MSSCSSPSSNKPLLSSANTEVQLIQLIKADQVMNLECSQSFDSWDEEQQGFKGLPIIMYRSVAIQTQSPSMVDKAVQVNFRRQTEPYIQEDYEDGESSANEIDIQDETKDKREMEKKRKHLANDSANDLFNKRQLLDKLSHHDDSVENYSLIQKHHESMMQLVLQEDNQMDGIVGVDDCQLDDRFDVDDRHIFTHQPTGLRYQIFNKRRSVNKEMMEQVFASVIGKEDKFYVCLYPDHRGLCHSQAGRSTKLRAVKNHLTSHLFLYRCRLCGRAYKYYNNLFNHFNRHPRICKPTRQN